MNLPVLPTDPQCSAHHQPVFASWIKWFAAWYSTKAFFFLYRLHPWCWRVPHLVTWIKTDLLCWLKQHQFFRERPRGRRYRKKDRIFHEVSSLALAHKWAVVYSVTGCLPCFHFYVTSSALRNWSCLEIADSQWNCLKKFLQTQIGTSVPQLNDYKDFLSTSSTSHE